MNNQFAGTAVAAALAAAPFAAAPNVAQATNITEHVTFTASGLGAGAPVDPVTGSFSVTFDPTQDYPSLTSGVVIDSINLPINGNALFSYVQAGGLGQMEIIVGNGQCASGCYEFDVANSAPFFNGKGSDTFKGNDFFFYYTGGQQFTTNIGRYTITSGSGTPEPTTWALMIAGFGLAGAALRRPRTMRPAKVGADRKNDKKHAL